MYWPKGNQLNLEVVQPNKNLHVKMLGYNQSLNWINHESGIQINLPNVPWNELPSQIAWVLKFDNK